MRVVAIGLVSVLCVAGLAEAQTGDDAAGRRVIQQFDEARSKADWKTASNLYLEDGTNLTSSGEWRRGRADIEKRGAATTAGVYKAAGLPPRSTACACWERTLRSLMGRSKSATSQAAKTGGDTAPTCW